MAAEGGRGGMSLSHHKKWENGGGRRQEDKPPLRMSFLVRDWTNIVTVFEITPTPLKLKPCLLKLPPSVSSCTLGIGAKKGTISKHGGTQCRRRYGAAAAATSIFMEQLWGIGIGEEERKDVRYCAGGKEGGGFFFPSAPFVMISA